MKKAVNEKTTKLAQISLRRIHDTNGIHNVNANGTLNANGIHDAKGGIDNETLIKVKDGVKPIEERLGKLEGQYYHLAEEVKNEVKDGVKPIEERLGRIEGHFYHFAEDLGYIKALLESDEAKVKKVKKDTKQ
ncbi:unnamed protein product [Rhizophagus irregularis]|nr:unnamed protein product [Rhizophagus irregularis]